MDAEIKKAGQGMEFPMRTIRCLFVLSGRKTVISEPAYTVIHEYGGIF